jgi:hypothetical protein
MPAEFLGRSRIVFRGRAAIGGEPETDCYVTIRKRGEGPTLTETLAKAPGQVLNAQKYEILLPSGIYQTQRNLAIAYNRGTRPSIWTCVDLDDRRYFSFAVGKTERVRVKVDGVVYRGTIMVTEVDPVADGTNVRGDLIEEAVVN